MHHEDEMRPHQIIGRAILSADRGWSRSVAHGHER
jgi:hypothetical protein